MADLDGAEPRAVGRRILARAVATAVGLTGLTTGLIWYCGAFVAIIGAGGVCANVDGPYIGEPDPNATYGTCPVDVAERVYLGLLLTAVFGTVYGVWGLRQGPRLAPLILTGLLWPMLGGAGAVFREARADGWLTLVVPVVVLLALTAFVGLPVFGLLFSPRLRRAVLFNDGTEPIIPDSADSAAETGTDEGRRSPVPPSLRWFSVVLQAVAIAGGIGLALPGPHIPNPWSSFLLP